MRGNWCKNCNKFVDMKKDYTRAKIAFLIFLIAIFIGLIAFFPWGGLITLFIGGLCIFDSGVLGARRACSICGKTVRRKRIPK